MLIRPETAADVESIRQVHRLAFGGDDERRIVDRLRETAHPIISLVADDGGVVGHIMFSPLTLGQGNARLLMGLGPVASHAGTSATGNGSALVVAGLEECRRLGVAGSVVVGHPGVLPTLRVHTRFSLRADLPVRSAGRCVHGTGTGERRI